MLSFWKKPKITLDKLSFTVNYRYDSWNNVENGQVRYDAYNNNTFLGYVDFRKSTGQIGIIDVEEKYRRCGIATFLLTNVEKELSGDIFAICSKDHYFWSKQKGYMWHERPHNSVTGSGYKKLI